MKALVIETAFLGDVIVSLALARGLRKLFPEASIAYLVRPDAADIVRACPDVNEVITFDKKGAESGAGGIRRKAAELNRLHFDTVFLLHSSTRSQALCRGLNASRKVGYDSMRNAGLSDMVEDAGWRTRYERTLLLLEPLRQCKGASITAVPQLSTKMPSAMIDFAERHSKIVAVAPGSVWHTKKWGDDRYRSLVRRLAHQGVAVVLIGGKAEVDFAEGLVAESNVLNLIGQLSMTESAGVIARSAILVANDSAPLHLATAVGTPAVGIFGPTVPEAGFGPQSAGSVVLQESLWCRPCTSHGSMECPIYTHECMSRIRVERVLDQVLSMLS